MTTIPLTVQAIRRLLNDEPDTDTLASSIAAAGTTTMTVTDVTKHSKGNWWELQDDSGDVVFETAVDTSTSIITIRRGYLDSTAAAHSNGAVLAKEPRFRYDVVSQAINSILDVDLYAEGIFDLQEHQVTSSATTNYYDSPTATCLEFKDVYQKTATMTEPRRELLWFSPKPRNADTTLYASGKYFVIRGNYGTAGTDKYYVTCAHKHTISTLTSGAERIVQYLACASVLEWTEPRRTAGPTNQGDRTVRPGTAIGTAGYFRTLAEEQVNKERRTIEDIYPTARRFVRN